MRKIKKLLDEYTFPGFRPRAAIKGKFGDHQARVIQLERRQKKLFAAPAAPATGLSMTGGLDWPGIYHAAMPEYIYHLRFDGLIV